MLGITVLPKLQGTSEYTIRSQADQFVSLLRTVQMRAMQNTQPDSSTCHQIRFLANSAGLSAQNTTAGSNGSCASGLIDASNAQSLDFLIIEDLTNYSALNTQGNPITSLSFDSWGKPTPNVGTCVNANRNPNNHYGCKITIETVSICIEEEGYIRACL